MAHRPRAAGAEPRARGASAVEVSREADGASARSPSGEQAGCASSRAASDLPLRWMVAEGERTRGAVRSAAATCAPRSTGVSSARTRLPPWPMTDLRCHHPAASSPRGAATRPCEGLLRCRCRPMRLRIAPLPRAAMIPVAVLTGFLGSGKTTLLGRLLQASRLLAHGRDHQRVRRGRARPRSDRDQRGELRRAADRLPVLHGARRPGADAGGHPAAARRRAAWRRSSASSSRPAGSPIRRPSCTR